MHNKEDEPIPDVYMAVAYGMRDGEIALDVRVFSSAEPAKLWPAGTGLGRGTVFRVHPAKEVGKRMYAVIVYRTLEDGRLAMDPGVFPNRAMADDFVGMGEHGLRYAVFVRELDDPSSSDAGEWGACRRRSGG